MQTLIKEKVNVAAIFRSFKDAQESTDGTNKRIEPLKFKTQKGNVHRIAQVRKSYALKKGAGTHVHFVIRTDQDRYFELVYDSGKMMWILLYEFDDQLLFNE